MPFVERIQHRVAHAFLRQLPQFLADRPGAAIHFRRRHQPAAPGGLGFHQAQQVAVGHRRDRVMTHAGFGQQLFPDEQVALIDRAAVYRQRRRYHSETFPQRGEQGVGHRADIALRGAVESGAVFEVELAAALFLQPGQRLQRQFDRLLCRAGARFQADDRRLRADRRFVLRHAVQLHRRQAVLHQKTGDIGRAGKIIRDYAEQHQIASFFCGKSMPAKILITALSSSLP
ncbi:Uncharacterised protein [Serratia marcescens]|nr:Uncharacterised protein [Serratia marcescens]